MGNSKWHSTGGGGGGGEEDESSSSSSPPPNPNPDPDPDPDPDPNRAEGRMDVQRWSLCCGEEMCCGEEEEDTNDTAETPTVADRLTGRKIGIHAEEAETSVAADVDMEMDTPIPGVSVEHGGGDDDCCPSSNSSQ